MKTIDKALATDRALFDKWDQSGSLAHYIYLVAVSAMFCVRFDAIDPGNISTWDKRYLENLRSTLAYVDQCLCDLRSKIDDPTEHWSNNLPGSGYELVRVIQSITYFGSLDSKGSLVEVIAPLQWTLLVNAFDEAKCDVDKLLEEANATVES